MLQDPAVELPEELFLNVLSYFVLQNPRSTSSRLIVHASKRELAELCLVARYWAKIIRPLLFHDIYIRSRASLDRYFAFTESPVRLEPRLEACLRKTTVEFTGPWSGYWACLSWRNSPIALSMPGTAVFVLREGYVPDILSSPRSKAGYAPRSWWIGLPRSLPFGTVRFSELKLVDVRFKHVADLLSLANDVQGLRTLDCRKVKFDDLRLPGAPVPTRRRPARNGNRAYEIILSDCGSDNSEVQALLSLVGSSSRHGAPGYVLDAQTWNRLHDLVRWMILRPKRNRYTISYRFHQAFPRKGSGCICAATVSVCVQPISAHLGVRLLYSCPSHDVRDALAGSGTAVHWSVLMLEQSIVQSRDDLRPPTAMLEFFAELDRRAFERHVNAVRLYQPMEVKLYSTPTILILPTIQQRVRVRVVRGVVANEAPLVQSGEDKYSDCLVLDVHAVDGLSTVPNFRDVGQTWKYIDVTGDRTSVPILRYEISRNWLSRTLMSCIHEVRLLAGGSA
ncbi:uncharacterized protein PHACADRAFT_196606 [Phanerochaete carnosa HHB-10118-sp]|uniref:Uncharacterized protein n=1 Tax=Phanerochaete carnosa (strain HHB-10118-sp) TaxID=650164 RepID=K5UVW0_PHACS|nr:uncharacterized protein PHACADRAFT_196606 [Phanerochaete carnosa HHB-10118-sp]EKM54176.1 hypothetical protein PHACADRAFT_196606 [Phanerochaete carnosa HHB-10118-sp]